jgi:protein subunit release factor A
MSSNTLIWNVLRSVCVPAIHLQYLFSNPFAALQMEDAASLLSDADPDVRREAQQEAALLEQRHSDVAQQLVLGLVLPEADDQCDVVLEVRAGAGGLEASLFAEQLFDMYSHFAGTLRSKVCTIMHHVLGAMQ